MKNTKLIIKSLCREIRRLRKENKKLHDKHWEECRQIALYDAENKSLRGALSQAFEMIADLMKSGDHRTAGKQEVSAEQPEAPAEPEQPKKTYKEDYFERFPNAKHWENGTPLACRSLKYDVEFSCDKLCADCWNEVMPDEHTGNGVKNEQNRLMV